jgi:hypothetical protein
MKSPKVLSRFVLMLSMASGLSVIANWSEWNQYWNQTIYRVQTVDFNILSHTLPAKLSPVLAKKRYLELQRTLDSNYGLFGLIVTDCKEVKISCQKQKIIFASNGKRDWKSSFSANELPGNSYDLLRTPSPLITENTYKDSRSQEAVSTTRNNKGKIIGRVYYVRGIPPSFFSDYTNWLTNIWSTKGTHSYYALKTGVFISMGFVVWIAIEFLLYRKYIQHLQTIHEKQRLEEQLNEVINQNSNLIAKQRNLINQQEKSRTDLENSRQSYQKRTLQINNDIKQLIDSQSQQSSKVQSTEKLLTTRQKELDTDRASKLLTLEQLEQKEIEVSQLQQQKRLQDNQYQKITDHLLSSQKDLSQTCQKLAESEKQKQDFEIKNEDLFAKLEHSSKEIDELRQRLASTPDNEIELKAALQSVKLENHIMEKLYEETTNSIVDRSRRLEDINLVLENDRDDLQLKVWDLEEENTWHLECLTNYTRIHSIDLFPSFTVDRVTDLSALSIVIVGGHTSTRKEVIKALSTAYSIKDFGEIPPTNEESANEKSVRRTIENCDLIAVITKYIGHDLTDIISELSKKGALKGKVVYLKNRGKSGIVREISSCLLDSYLNN